MTATHRATFSLLTIVLSLIAGLAWSLSFLSDARDDAERAAGDLAATRTLVGEIKLLQPISLSTNAPQTSGTRLPHLLDDAMQSAGIDTDSLKQITPQPPHRAGQGTLTEISTQLVFRHVSLRQLILLLTKLTDDNNWLRVNDIHLTYPAEAAVGETLGWNMEVTVSYLTHAPSGDAGVTDFAAN